MQSVDLKELAKKVHDILVNNPSTRDDDRLLIVELWSSESLSDSSKDFFDEMLKGYVSFPDTVTRVRRKLQEKNESLRGEKWVARHKMQRDITEDLNFYY